MERKFGLLFPGQGSQKPGMGKDLYEIEPAAKWVYDRADEITGRDIKKLCFEGSPEELSTTINSQPAIFTTSMAVLNVLAEKIKGTPVGNEEREMFSNADIAVFASLAMGLSLGEPTSLVAAGVLSFEDALRFVVKRGEFMEEASRKNEGKMASIIGLDLEKVEELCVGIGCQVANLNCPGQTVVSGHAGKIELLADLAKNAGARRTIMLKVSGAFHSELMFEAKEKLKAVLSEIVFSPPAIDFISNVDAQIISDPEKIRKNLADQLDSRTLWSDSVVKASSLGVKDYLEIGPGNVLAGLLKKIDPSLSTLSLCTAEEIREAISVTFTSAQ
ncbi:MAG: ACP S-malonyltransferase [Candidatus Omnitrophota bacterium]